MVFVHKDTYPKIIDTYIQAQKNATKISHYNPVDNVKPMKETANLIENSRMSSLKNAPIRNSDKKTPPPINSYQKFGGSKPLPTFKKDLNHWGIICN